jgi:hypothetical protein
MTAAARIPFTPADEHVIRQLGTWMTFVGVVHLLLGLVFLTCAGYSGLTVPALLDGTPFGAVLAGVQGLLFAITALLTVVEGALLIQTRMALTGVLTSDSEDQALISRSIHRLKLFFMTELAFFAVNLVVGIVTVVLTWVAPEAGQAAADLIQSWGGGR